MMKMRCYDEPLKRAERWAPWGSVFEMVLKSEVPLYQADSAEADHDGIVKEGITNVNARGRTRLPPFPSTVVPLIPLETTHPPKGTR